MTILDVLDAMDAKLATVSGLRVASYKIDNPTPPIAYSVAPDIPAYHETFDGKDTLAFAIVLLVSPTDARAAERQIAQYIDAAGIPAVFEADQTLGGKCANALVESFTRFDAVVADTIGYPGGTFHVPVML